MKVIVEYEVKIRESIDWPDDEIQEFTYENLEANLEPSSENICHIENISSILVDGEEYYF